MMEGRKRGNFKVKGGSFGERGGRAELLILRGKRRGMRLVPGRAGEIFLRKRSRMILILVSKKICLLRGEGGGDILARGERGDYSKMFEKAIAAIAGWEGAC